MNGYFSYPAYTYKGKNIPKTKFYENAKIDNRLKEKFVKEIDKIIWQHNLSKDTVNVDSAQEVTEIQIFDIHLKGENISQDVLMAIDKAIAYPVIFQIVKGSKMKIKAAYKKLSKNISQKSLSSQYLETDWFDISLERKPLPVSLSLSKLYEAILDDLMSIQLNIPDNLNVEEKLDEYSKVVGLKRKYDELRLKRDREKQFNKRVELNYKLKKLYSQIEGRIK
ncbi:DUF4391 domain-containing protein [Thermodesulfobium sp. 4217-1]|uniref:DUF4391 domain-containing protein n=1 Tax=Thermodesulfobium sp. 4217-1 TaxID=3120013 RepID=UPI003221BB88